MAEEKQSQGSVISELRELRSLVEEVSTSLRSQREILKMRNMSLPPMVLTSLDAVNADLSKLESTLVGDQVELGQLRALAETAALVNSTLNLDRVLEDAMDIVISLTEAERGYIILVAEDTGELEFRIQRDNEIGASRAASSSGDGIQISYTILNEVIETGEPLLADNAYKDERLQGNLSIASFALRSVLCVPLKYKDHVIGAVYIDNRLRAGVFTERVKNLLMAFANTAAVAITNARMYTSIQTTLAEITDVKELMDNVFASIASGVITTDATDHVDTFNRAAAQILDRKPDEAIGHPLHSVMPKFHADIDEHLGTIRMRGEQQHLDAEMDVPSRGRIAVSMRLTPLKNADEQTQGVAMVLEDLTEQKEREYELSIMKRYLPPMMVENIHSISQLALGGERREVTCMFVDVRPLYTMPEDFRPTDIMNTLNGYLATATGCIHKVGGVIDKYMGNIIMGLFNTQLNPMDDHSLQATEAALLIRDAFVEMYARLGIDPNPHYYHVGINTGVATMGNVGSLNRRDFTAIGDTINLSKRLEENAADGQIIISETTREHLEQVTGGHFDFRLEERRPIKVKGREQETRIYEVFRA